MNHLTTRSILSCSLDPSEMAANRSGCSHQYAGNSVSEVGDRITVSRQPSISPPGELQAYKVEQSC